ncbi:NAD+ synthase [Pacificispira sp.]|uniref:NAD+ synthase n=1 Tax=Pacificispira sp. TaxID=2888761 RepID=UPI003B51C5D9
MTDRLTVALAQLNPTVGDIAGNAALARKARADAAAAGADLLLLPELFLSGYQPEDLVLKPFFLDKLEEAASALAAETADGGPDVLLPTPWRGEGVKPRNAVLYLSGGRIETARFKHDLPNYGVFDEKRVFDAGPMPGPISIKGVRVGVPICEDIWTADVVECLDESGAEILLVPNGSPYEDGKEDVRIQLGVNRVRESGLPIAYLNQVGGQDELVYDGSSFVMNPDYSLAIQMPAFESAISIAVFERTWDGWHCRPGDRVKPPERMESIYRAMTLGLRDYVRKNGFPGVVLGMSGGIDSALSAAVAVDALGPQGVHCVMMPSPYTSQESLDDAAAACALLGVRLDEVNIGPAMKAFQEMLAPVFGDTESGVTEENIQSRSRGLTLMAISNKQGAMVLTTGNKSEMSTGYATLYGDMCGGYSVLKDIYKSDVFRLCEWRNEGLTRNDDPLLLGPAGPVMPQRIITKPPSAELKPDQKDQDSLPPYDVLDDILNCLIEREMSVAEIAARGHPPELVQRVWRMLDIAEYKRRQAPPGVKITARAFGRDRRYPITNGFRKIL